jgi:hypothetical protein
MDADRDDLACCSAILPVAVMKKKRNKKAIPAIEGASVPDTSGRAPLIALLVAASATIAGLVVYYLLASKRAAGEFGFPLDDSWIHVRFAQCLFSAHGFSFNPGELTSTTTSALWTVLLALAHAATHEFLFTSIVVNGLLAVMLCVVVYELALTIVPSKWAAFSAGLLVAATAPLPWWVLSGMEPPLYAVLALLGMLLHVRSRAPGARAGALLWAAIVFALAGLARPECLLLFPLAAMDRLVMAIWIEKQERGLARWASEMAKQVPAFAVVACLPFIYNHVVTGLWLPSSFYSKQQWTSIAGALATGQMQNLVQALVSGPWQQLWSLISTWAHDNAAMVAPFFVGLYWLTRQVLVRESKHRSLIIPMALVVQPFLWAWLSGYRPADFQSQRYLAALNPLYLLMGVMGGWWLLSGAKARGMMWARIGLVGVALAASLAVQPKSAATYALNVKNITEMQVTIARWLRDNAPKGSLLAVNDVGAIGAITDDPVLDLQGLVTTQVLPLRSMKERAAGRAPMLLSQFIFDRRPDYLVIFPSWYPELDQRRDLFAPVYWVQLRDNITSGSETMVVYKSVWADRKDHAR